MINSIIFYFVPTCINAFTVLTILSMLLKEKFNFKDKKTYIGIFLLILLIVLNIIYVTGFIRIVVTLIILTIMTWYIFRKNIFDCFTATCVDEFIMIAAEIICMLLFSIFKINLILFSVNSFISNCTVNLSVSLCALLLFKINFVRTTCEKVLNYLSKTDIIKKIIVLLIFFITLNILLMFIYSTNINGYVILINLIFVIIYSVIIYFLLNEKNKNIEFKQQNEILISNLFEYEKMLDYQRVNNHENKNQLLVIKDMIRKTNKKALEYIDTIIDEKRKDDEGLYTYAKIIPAGGLQGLIYQKMLEMKEKHINIELNVDKEVRKVNLDHISNRTKYDLYRAVGIIIDNAIDETLKLKEKSIMIIMYKEDNNIVIEVSNRCKDIPDLSKIDEKGYTTKSTGHGYGLSLLKSIANNDCISNIRSINKDIFTQIIKVKIN